MGYKIHVNGKQVWESDGSERLISTIHAATPRGDVATIRVPPEEQDLYLQVEYLAIENRPLDLVEKIKYSDIDATVEKMAEEFGGPQVGEGNPLVDTDDPMNDPYAPSEAQIARGEAVAAATGEDGKVDPEKLAEIEAGTFGNDDDTSDDGVGLTL